MSLCEKINDLLNKNGFKSSIYKENFIVFESAFKIKINNNYFLRFHKNKILVFTTIDICDILKDKFSNEDLAFALSQKFNIFSSENISINIKDGSLSISSIFCVNFFMSTSKVYEKIYFKMVDCQNAFEDILKELEKQSV